LSFVPLHLDPLRDLHSFPTRRSSDLSRIRTELSAAPNTPPVMSLKISRSAPLRRAFCCASSRAPTPSAPVSAAKPTIAGRVAPRSEEHTSELQSRFDLVCRLLLAQKN